MSVIEKLRLGLQGQSFQVVGIIRRGLEVLPENPGLFCPNPFTTQGCPFPRLKKTCSCPLREWDEIADSRTPGPSFSESEAPRRVSKLTDFQHHLRVL